LEEGLGVLKDVLATPILELSLVSPALPKRKQFALFLMSIPLREIDANPERVPLEAYYFCFILVEFLKKQLLL
jgi:hypothetical protein